MAVLYVNEYVRCARDQSGNALQCGEEPAIAKYPIAIGGASVAGPVLNPKTRFVQLHTDAICSIAVDVVAPGPVDPVAVTTKDRLPANATVFRGVVAELVQQAIGMKIAVIANT